MIRPYVMMKRRSTSHPVALVAVVLAVGLAGPTAGFAQVSDAPIVIGESFNLRSDALDEDRTVLVATPRGYETSSATFPVLYLLDGDSHLLHTAGIVDFLASNQYMPEVIVVGLPNTDRTRDLTPATKHGRNQNMPTAGGAEAFLSFLTDELAPEIEARYRTAPYRILVGHSLGGLFAIYSLMEQPEAFDALVAISPSLWWDRQALVSEAGSFLDDHPDLDGFLYLTLGNEGGDMLKGVRGFTDILEEKAPASLKWHFTLMERENHGSVPHRSTYDALEALYNGWSLPRNTSRNGDLAAFDEHFAALSARYGYEIEAPEATVNQLGYRLMSEKKIDDAVAVFERNVKRYPESANVYDSVGDAYNAAGLLNKAMKSYQRACTMGEADHHPNAELYCANARRATERVSKEDR